jgi:hypothetical protein
MITTHTKIQQSMAVKKQNQSQPSQAYLDEKYQLSPISPLQGQSGFPSLMKSLCC